jgi:hypothetical protein
MQKTLVFTGHPIAFGWSCVEIYVTGRCFCSFQWFQTDKNPYIYGAPYSFWVIRCGNVPCKSSVPAGPRYRNLLQDSTRRPRRHGTLARHISTPDHPKAIGCPVNIRVFVCLEPLKWTKTTTCYVNFHTWSPKSYRVPRKYKRLLHLSLFSFICFLIVLCFSLFS